jgi:hypothetical protein
MSTCTQKKKCKIYVFVRTIFGGHNALSPIKCSYYTSLGHMKEKCCKTGKDGKGPSTTIIFLEVLIDDEHATLEKINILCGIKVDVFS